MLNTLQREYPALGIIEVHPCGSDTYRVNCSTHELVLNVLENEESVKYVTKLLFFLSEHGSIAQVNCPFVFRSTHSQSPLQKETVTLLWKQGTLVCCFHFRLALLVQRPKPGAQLKKDSEIVEGSLEDWTNYCWYFLFLASQFLTSLQRDSAIQVLTTEKQNGIPLTLKHTSS